MDGPLKLGASPARDRFQVELEFDVDEEKKSLLKNVSVKRVVQTSADIPRPDLAVQPAAEPF